MHRTSVGRSLDVHGPAVTPDSQLPDEVNQVLDSRQQPTAYSDLSGSDPVVTNPLLGRGLYAYNKGHELLGPH